MKPSEIILSYTTQIVEAYLAHNTISPVDLGPFIRAVQYSLEALSVNDEPRETVSVEPKPAVPIKNSIHDTYLVCLEDGSKRKMLKRYLESRYNMTPDEYRKKWKLPADYPMTAPDYSRRRSQLAKNSGLGQLGAESRAE